MTASSPAPSGRVRAVLEALRAPLLLSPVADVLAGWCVMAGAARDGASVDGAPGVFARAALAGCCLLASGMAQNALVDLEDDRRRRPSRPLPRGAVGTRPIAVVMVTTALAALALAATISTDALAVAALVLAVSAAYHAGLKRRRLVGCGLLGAARGLDLLLGAVAWASLHPGASSWPAPVQAAAGLYALYMAGASLHASTDDEHGSRVWSRAGLGLSFATLGTLLLAAGWQAWQARGAALAPAAGLAVLAWATARLAQAAGRLPAPALTGVALSNLHLVDAGLCLVAAPLALAAPSAAVVLALYWLSRRLLGVFPPS